jgi:hypothetical protein
MIVNYYSSNYRNIEDNIGTLINEIKDLQTLQEDTIKLQRHTKIINDSGIACALGAIIFLGTLSGMTWDRGYNSVVLACGIIMIFKTFVQYRFSYEAAKPLRQKYTRIYPEFSLDLGEISFAQTNSTTDNKINKSREKVMHLLSNFSMSHKDLYKLKFATQTELGQILPKEVWSIISNYSAALTASYKLKFAQKTDLGETLPPEVWRLIGDYINK